MDPRLSRQSDGGPKQKRLRTLASRVKFSGGNTLLHQFVLDNSHPNHCGSESYLNAVLLSMRDAPARLVNAQNDDGYGALHLAVLKKNFAMVKKLLSCLVNIDVNAACPSASGNTALHLASELGHLSIVQLLLDKGAGVYVINKLNETALCSAAMSGHVDVIKLLVSEGAYVNPVYGWCTPLCYAVRSGSLEAVDFLVHGGAEVGFPALLKATRSGNVDILKLLLDTCVNFRIESENGRDLLLSAVASGNLAAVELLVGRGADVNARGKDGSTPLHRAVFWQSLEIAAFLIDLGADVDARDEDGRTPLHEAVHVGNLDIVKLLVGRGADLRADADGWTPLHAAAYKGHADVVRALLDKGADASAKNGHGQTPLDLAREKQNQSCMDALQNAGR